MSSIYCNLQHEVRLTLFYVKVSQTRVHEGTAGGLCALSGLES